MKFVKKNKYTIIVIVVFILLVFAGAKAIDLFFPNEGKAIYGNRLDGIEEVEIKDNKIEQVLGELEEDGSIVKTENVIRGRLVTFTITVNDDCNADTAKGLAPKTITHFDDKQKAYYDFQVLIKKNTEEDKTFPIIGYKHHNNQDFVFTKDRVAE